MNAGSLSARLACGLLGTPATFPERNPMRLFSTASGLPAKFEGWRWQFEFYPQALWVGAHWIRVGNCVDAWICLLPCLSLHVSWWWHDPAQ